MQFISCVDDVINLTCNEPPLRRYMSTARMRTELKLLMCGIRYVVFMIFGIVQATKNIPLFLRAHWKAKKLETIHHF